MRARLADAADLASDLPQAATLLEVCGRQARPMQGKVQQQQGCVARHNHASPGRPCVPCRGCNRRLRTAGHSRVSLSCTGL